MSTMHVEVRFNSGEFYGFDVEADQWRDPKTWDSFAGQKTPPYRVYDEAMLAELIYKAVEKLSDRFNMGLSVAGLSIAPKVTKKAAS